MYDKINGQVEVKSVSIGEVERYLKAKLGVEKDEVERNGHRQSYKF